MYKLNDSSQESLWKEILAHEIDYDPDCDFSFVARLARDNDWSVEYAQGAIVEYKKFIFLVCVAGHGCTPSDEVDQVWHLHLQYSQNYWKDFCKNILGREVHHGPTKGGGSERSKYKNYYSMTRQSYLKFFGERAPENYWPPAKRRFGDAPHFKRVNMRGKYLIDFQKIHSIVDKLVEPLGYAFIVVGLIYVVFG